MSVYGALRFIFRGIPHDYYHHEFNFILMMIVMWDDKGEMEVTRRLGRTRRKLLVDLKDRRGYSHLKDEALDRTTWRNRFGGYFEPVVRQNTE
jgi:hypothetical protein